MTHETWADECDHCARRAPRRDAMATVRGCSRQKVNGPYRAPPPEARVQPAPLGPSWGEPLERGVRRSTRAMSALGLAFLASSSLAFAAGFAQLLETNRLLSVELEHTRALLHTRRLDTAGSPSDRRIRSLGRFVSPIGEGVWDVDRRLFNEWHWLEASLDTRPHYAHGHLLGVRMNTNELAFLGIEAGDVVLAIDGLVLDERTLAVLQALDVAGSLVAETRVEVAILRRGEPYTLTYLLA